VRAPCTGVDVVISVSETVLDDCIEFVSHTAALMSNPSCCLPLYDHMTRAAMEQTGDRGAAGRGSERNVGNQADRSDLIGNNSGDNTGISSSSDAAAGLAAVGQRQPSARRGEANCGSMMESKAQVCMSVAL
jgi:hypothetical protein